MINMNSQIPSVSHQTPGMGQRLETPDQQSSGFSDQVKQAGKAVAQVDDMQQNSDASIQDLLSGKKKMAVIGLGYVGLPIALEFARKISVIGFDIKADRVDLMKQGIDPSNELEAKDFEGCDIQFTANLEDLKEAAFYIVAVPTPIDANKQPDLRPLKGAAETVGRQLTTGAIRYARLVG